MENITKSTRFLFCDVETGGIGPDYSLLTAYFLLTDDKFNAVDDLYLYVKPNDGIYRVCGEAMNVNRIDLKVHDTKAITYREAGTKLYNWIQKHSSDGKDRLVVVGHNVAGDRNKICECLVTRPNWDKFASYRLRDTQTVACFLIDCGLIPNTVSGSLESLSTHFGIKNDENAFHDAKYDTEKTAQLYQKLIGSVLASD